MDDWKSSAVKERLAAWFSENRTAQKAGAPWEMPASEWDNVPAPGNTNKTAGLFQDLALQRQPDGTMKEDYREAVSILHASRLVAWKLMGTWLAQDASRDYATLRVTAADPQDCVRVQQRINKTDHNDPHFFNSPIYDKWATFFSSRATGNGLFLWPLISVPAEFVPGTKVATHFSLLVFIRSADATAGAPLSIKSYHLDSLGNAHATLAMRMVTALRSLAAAHGPYLATKAEVAWVLPPDADPAPLATIHSQKGPICGMGTLAFFYHVLDRWIGGQLYAKQWDEIDAEMQEVLKWTEAKRDVCDIDIIRKTILKPLQAELVTSMASEPPLSSWLVDDMTPLRTLEHEYLSAYPLPCRIAFYLDHSNAFTDAEVAFLERYKLSDREIQDGLQFWTRAASEQILLEVLLFDACTLLVKIASITPSRFTEDVLYAVAETSLALQASQSDDKSTLFSRLDRIGTGWSIALGPLVKKLHSAFEDSDRFLLTCRTGAKAGNFKTVISLLTENAANLNTRELYWRPFATKLWPLMVASDAPFSGSATTRVAELRKVVKRTKDLPTENAVGNPWVFNQWLANAGDPVERVVQRWIDLAVAIQNMKVDDGTITLRKKEFMEAIVEKLESHSGLMGIFLSRLFPVIPALLGMGHYNEFFSSQKWSALETDLKADDTDYYFSRFPTSALVNALLNARRAALVPVLTVDAAHDWRVKIVTTLESDNKPENLLANLKHPLAPYAVVQFRVHVMPLLLSLHAQWNDTTSKQQQLKRAIKNAFSFGLSVFTWALERAGKLRNLETAFEAAKSATSATPSSSAPTSPAVSPGAKSTVTLSPPPSKPTTPSGVVVAPPTIPTVVPLPSAVIPPPLIKPTPEEAQAAAWRAESSKASFLNYIEQQDEAVALDRWLSIPDDMGNPVPIAVQTIAPNPSVRQILLRILLHPDAFAPRDRPPVAVADRRAVLIEHGASDLELNSAQLSVDDYSLKDLRAAIREVILDGKSYAIDKTPKRLADWPDLPSDAVLTLDNSTWIGLALTFKSDADNAEVDAEVADAAEFWQNDATSNKQREQMLAKVLPLLIKLELGHDNTVAQIRRKFAPFEKISLAAWKRVAANLSTATFEEIQAYVVSGKIWYYWAEPFPRPRPSSSSFHYVPAIHYHRPPPPTRPAVEPIAWIAPVAQRPLSAYEGEIAERYRRPTPPPAHTRTLDQEMRAEWIQLSAPSTRALAVQERERDAFVAFTTARRAYIRAERASINGGGGSSPF